MASPEIRRLRFEAPAGEFNLSRLERVIYGPGKIAALKDEMERRGSEARCGGDHRRGGEAPDIE